jgi:hypothetical protein
VCIYIVGEISVMIFSIIILYTGVLMSQTSASAMKTELPQDAVTLQTIPVLLSLPYTMQQSEFTFDKSNAPRDASDSGTAAVCPHAPNARTDITMLTPLVPDALPTPVSMLPPIVGLSAPVIDARTALHSYFSQFNGCRGCVAEVVRVAPEDADLLDLRRSVPIESHPAQYLDLSSLHELEAVHVPGTAGISSGDSGAESDYDSHSSFIDDALPTELTTADAAYVAHYVAQALPLTAALLRPELASPATVSARKRRCIITSSSSSSPPRPHFG